MSFIQANGIYSLINAKGGTCIDLSAGDNMSITGYEFHNGENQTWTFENAGVDKTFFLKSKGTNKYLSAAGEPGNDRKVVGSDSRYAWRVEDQPGVDSGVRISPANNANVCVDLSDNGNPTPGNPIELWGRWDPGENQVWKLQKIQ